MDTPSLSTRLDPCPLLTCAHLSSQPMGSKRVGVTPIKTSSEDQGEISFPESIGEPVGNLKTLRQTRRRATGLTAVRRHPAAGRRL